MVFLQSELAVTLFCGFMKSTPLCVNRRLEQLQNKRGSEVVKTDAGFTAGVNRICWWHLIFGEDQKGEKKNLPTVEKRNLGPFKSSLSIDQMQNLAGKKSSLYRGFPSEVPSGPLGGNPSKADGFLILTQQWGPAICVL